MSANIPGEYIPKTQYDPTKLAGVAAANTASATTGAEFGSEENKPLETAFDVDGTNTNVEEPVGDQFVVNANASVEELEAQKEQMGSTLDTWKGEQEDTQDGISTLDTTIATQEKSINKANEVKETITARNEELKNSIQESTAQLNTINASIADLEAQISNASSFFGAIGNAIKGFFGNGVDVNELKTQLETLKAEKEQIETQREADRKELQDNGVLININDGIISNLENSKKANEKAKADLQATLQEIQEKLQSGELSMDQMEQAIADAYAQQGIDASEEQIKGTSAVVADAINKGNFDGENTTNGGAITDGNKLAEDINNGMLAQDPSTGEFNGEAFAPALEEAGYTPEEAKQRTQIIEALATYNDIGLGISFDEIFNGGGSLLDISSVVDSAITQNVMKTAGTGKIVGNLKGFTSKKDMDDNASAIKDFQSEYSSLDSYYRANDIKDLEVDSYLDIAGRMYTDLSQGAVYNTTDIAEAGNEAASLMSSLKVKVSSGAGADLSFNARFENSKNKTDSIISRAENSLGIGQNEDIEECRVDFLTFTSNFRNAKTDGEKEQIISDMAELSARAQEIEKNPESNFFTDERLLVAF